MSKLFLDTNDKINLRYKIGEKIIDYNNGFLIRDMIIINSKIEKRKHGKSIVNEKLYKYRCNKCGFDCGKHYSSKNKKYKDEYWITENSLLLGSRCACCGISPQIVVKGINDIATTHPHLVKYFANIEDAYIHTYASTDTVEMICIDCKTKRQLKISILHSYKFSCPKCGDSIPYPEKLTFGIMKELKIDFEYHKIFEWSKNTIKLSGRKEYDFYFKYNDEEFIIETHGEQHYQDAWHKLEITQENDRIKKELALRNGIKEENYIVIDCRKSELEWIKDSILGSKLNEIFDLSNIDWLKSGKTACTTLVKIICKFWDNKKSNETTADLVKIFKMNRATIIKYLKQGNGIWCSYSTKEEKFKGSSKTGKINGCRPLIMFNKDGQLLGVFIHAKELSRQSKKLFGENLNNTNIYAVCLGKRKTYKKYIFKYIEDLTSDEYIKYDIENKLTELYNQDKTMIGCLDLVNCKE